MGRQIPIGSGKSKPPLKGGNPQCRKSYCSCRLNQSLVDRDYLDMLIHCVGVEFVAEMKTVADASMLDDGPKDWYFRVTE